MNLPSTRKSQATGGSSSVAETMYPSSGIESSHPETALSSGVGKILSGASTSVSSELSTSDIPNGAILSPPSPPKAPPALAGLKPLPPPNSPLPERSPSTRLCAATARGTEAGDSAPNADPSAPPNAHPSTPPNADPSRGPNADSLAPKPPKLSPSSTPNGSAAAAPVVARAG